MKTYKTSRLWFSVFIGCALVIVCICSNRALAQSNTFPSSGSVGIGTTSPTYKLQVNGSGNTAGDSVLVTDSNTVTTAVDIANTSSGAKKWRLQSVGSSVSGRVGNFELVETGSNLKALVVQPGGNVGIGTTTPGRKLEILASDGEALRLYRDANNVGWGVNMKFAFNNSNNTQVDLAGIHSLVQANTAGAEQGTLIFTTASSGTLTEKLRIDGSGNVGIGTASPTGKLDVSGTLMLTGNAFANGPSISNSYDGLLLVGGASLGVRINSQNNTTELLRVTNSGNVGIGTASPQYKLDVAGNINSNATITGNNILIKYQDVAEWVPSAEHLPAGTVVVLDPNRSYQVIASTVSYDTRVAGVVSEQPGIALGEKGDNKLLVATTGRVRVKVDASRGPIRTGDLLVTSDTPGTAMKSEPIDLGGVRIHRPGTLIGKALEPLAKGSGEILVLLSLQ